MNNPNFSSPGYTGYGSALSLDANKSQYVLINKTIDMVNKSFTWEMWAYPKTLSASTDYILVGACESKDTDKCLHLMVRSSKIYFAFYSDDCGGTTILQVNRWYHFAFVYNYGTKTQSIYLNGNLDCFKNESGPFQGNSSMTTIGAIDRTNDAIHPSKYWSGYIDQVLYVSRIKSAAEILSDATLVAYHSFDNVFLFDSGPNKINGVRCIID